MKLIKLIKQNILKLKIKINEIFFLLYDKYLACIYNLKKWWPVICSDNQYDFIFLLNIIKHKLKLIEEVWGVHTDHEHDHDEKEKLKELINILDRMIEIAVQEQDIAKHEEYQKLSKSFFNKLHRLHDKLWD